MTINELRELVTRTGRDNPVTISGEDLWQLLDVATQYVVMRQWVGRVAGFSHNEAAHVRALAEHGKMLGQVWNHAQEGSLPVALSSASRSLVSLIEDAQAMADLYPELPDGPPRPSDPGPRIIGDGLRRHVENVEEHIRDNLGNLGLPLRQTSTVSLDHGRVRFETTMKYQRPGEKG